MPKEWKNAANRMGRGIFNRLKMRFWATTKPARRLAIKVLLVRCNILEAIVIMTKAAR